LDTNDYCHDCLYCTLLYFWYFICSLL